MKNITYIVLAFLLLIAPVTSAQAAAAETTQTGMVNEEPAIVTPITLNDVLAAPTEESLQPVVIDQQKVAAETKKPETVQDMAERLVTARFGAGQFTAFAAIVWSESKWDSKALNAQSGACGIPQRLQCGGLINWSPEDQIRWMIDYIADRYHTPTYAWYFHRINGWY
ncbi:hypothetical protein KGQ71_04690 [Patescibacteria group bacterium]|nr:hypothetical protein [Patescibacteria group bacterium]